MDGSDVARDLSSLDDVLAHYGVKGMHWGVRKARNAPPGPAQSPDSKRADEFKARAKAGGHKALDTKELQELVNRMNLERQYDRVRERTPSEKIGKFVADTLLHIGKEEAKKYAAGQAAKQVTDLLKR